jgi:replicative DNA helicase
LGVPILLLSQLNREVEKRKKEDKRPQMSDLRESGAIEQDADIIIFISRKYAENDVSVDEETRNRVELVVAKHRNGERGIVEVRWRGEHVTFEDLDTKSYLSKNAPPEVKGGTFTVSDDGGGADGPFEGRSAEDIMRTPLRNPATDDNEDIF